MQSAILFTIFVRPSVCLSNAGIVPEWMHIGLSSLFDKLVEASFQFLSSSRRYKIPRETPSAGDLDTRGEKNFDFRPKWPFISEGP